MEARGTRRISRGRFLRTGAASALGLGMLGASGCGGETPGGDGAVEVVFTFGPDAGGGVRALVDEFNREHRGEVRVTWRGAPAASDEYFDQMKSELQAGQDTVDVIGGDVVWPAQFAANGWILDLSDRFTEGAAREHLPGPSEAVVYGGKRFGVPWFTDAGLFYYRKDLLEENGFSEPPGTWDEMKEMIEAVRSGSGTPNGYVFQGAADESGVVDGLEHIWNAGGDVLRGEEVVIASPEAAEGLRLRRSLITEGYAPRSTGDYTTQESQSAFTQGDVVFMRNWPFVYALLSDPDTSRVEPERVGVGAIPVSERGRESFSGLGGWNFMVNAASEGKLEEAWAFIEFMSAPEQQKRLALMSTRLPTLEALYRDREIVEEVPVASLGLDALRNSRPRPVSPFYSDMSLVMSEGLNAALKGDASIEGTLEELRRELQGIVDQT